MHISFELDEFGRLKCELADGSSKATVSAANMAVAVAELQRAMDDAQRTGTGDCWWLEGVGEYRWVIRRESQRATLVVLWSAGTLTGWEHVFWAQADFDELAASIRLGLASLEVQAG